MKICKNCRLHGRKTKRYEGKTHPFNEEFRKTEQRHYSLNGCGKNEYQHLYLIMEKLGFDVNKDIHQQFLDRHNPSLEEPMKYKKRHYAMENFYLPDGSVNPLSDKKKPVDNIEGL